MKNSKTNYTFEDDIYPYMDQEVTMMGYVRLDTPTTLTITYNKNKYTDFVVTLKESLNEYLNQW